MYMCIHVYIVNQPKQWIGYNVHTTYMYTMMGGIYTSHLIGSASTSKCRFRWNNGCITIITQPLHFLQCTPRYPNSCDVICHSDYHVHPSIDQPRGGWKGSHELYIVPVESQFSNRSGQFGDYVCYGLGKNLVTHNARSTFSNLWVIEQLGGRWALPPSLRSAPRE